MSAQELPLPNLVIIGVDKSGTTSLFRYLAQHPQICASDIKEVYYFERARRGEPLRSLDEYARHFQHCGGERYRLESTPSYFTGGDPVIRAIQETLWDPRMILILRDPVDRFWSYYNFVRAQTRISKDMGFDEYLETCLRLRRDGADGRRENFAYGALAGGFYADHLDDWLKGFGHRLRVVFFSDLVSDPQATVAELCRWLEIDAPVADRFDYRVENKTTQYRNRALQRVALAVNRRGRRFFRDRPGLRRALRGGYYAVNRDRRDNRVLDARHRARLQEIYADSNARLADQLQREGYPDLPKWLNDGTEREREVRT